MHIKAEIDSLLVQFFENLSKRCLESLSDKNTSELFNALKNSAKVSRPSLS